ncbi:MAG: NAD(+) synthase [Clostridia bacterium]|nr:NAD(+) synthase [Clostridia bacterium]
MKDGFIKVAAADFNLKLADTQHNVEQIKTVINNADKISANVLVLPELCITGYSCGDLFFSNKLVKGALDGLKDICQYTSGKYPVVVVGLPLVYKGKMYNCAAVVRDGKILGVVPKTVLPNYAEFNEKRYFASFEYLTDGLSAYIDGEEVPFGNNLVFCHEEMDEYTFGVEICEDLWAVNTPSEGLCKAGANIILNPSASNEYVGKADYRRLLVKATSSRLICGYVCANPGYTESTQDTVFSAHHLIGENGNILAENALFNNNNMIVSEIDVQHIVAERCKNTSFESDYSDDYELVYFEQEIKDVEFKREYDKNPFIPADNTEAKNRAEDILNIQSYALARRIEHVHANKCVIGISGGLDSTLAILVTVRAMDILKRPRTDILAITMPCFGTTNRTKSNSQLLCEYLGVDFKEINITKAVKQHFEDIEQDENNFDVAFENSQARERTQVLMDYANKVNGIVIGTGDLSELALGWATYNGDHMSMYGVNASVPKTLVRFLVGYEASNFDKNLASVLTDIVETPVSPELLPVDEKGEMTQKTEDLVGPYGLHDFYLYHMVKNGFSPSKIYRLATKVFEGEYSPETIKHWLKTFVRRFFVQQFKRSCLPDGPKVGSVSLSPRGDWQMPTDASAQIWLNEIEKS